jgi:hypothetical protein
LFKVIKAICLTSSLDHPYGSVKVSSPRYWVESNPLPVVNNTSLRKGDHVAVIIDNSTSVMSGVILGRLRDDQYNANSKVKSGTDIVFEADDFIIEADKDSWTLNKGEEPLLNYSKVFEALQAIEADLLVAQGGTTLSALLNNVGWVKSLSDPKFKH